MIDQRNKLQWNQNLLKWYKKNHRILPWRERKDPYAIWISEIMLQQTRVETVISYFNRFMKAFPTIEELSNGNIDEVLKLWEGLGYYSRAKNIHKTAWIITSEYGGRFPTNYKDVIALPGIGPYTAGAIMSIAYNERYPAVDGNVLRVISRVYCIEEDIGNQNTKKEIEEIVYSVIPKKEARDFNQALMELGATICTPTSPKCIDCPICKSCRALEEEKQDTLPVKAKKPKKKVEKRYVAIIKQDEAILMKKRPDKGLLAGLWEYPNVEGNNKEEFVSNCKKKYGILIKPLSFLGTEEHIFTHIHWKMKVYECSFENELQESEKIGNTMEWILEESRKNITIPTAFKRVEKLYEKI
ncbi:A/G-specific adenine glycosylase [Lutibacter sp. B2]|nr:A/G-specific adenine glycosylase [Lutibacter sp. B2]